MERFDWLTDETIELLGRGIALTVALTVITGLAATIVGVGVGIEMDECQRSVVSNVAAK